MTISVIKLGSGVWITNMSVFMYIVYGVIETRKGTVEKIVSA